MQDWRLIDTGENNGFYNMALDEAIAIACRKGIVSPTLRFYTWTAPCISIGYFQKSDRVVDDLRSKEDNTAIVRRITGGRAVLHGNDLSYSVVCGADNRLFPSNIKGTYTAIAKALIAGLEYLGIVPDPINSQNRASGARYSRPHAGADSARKQYHSSALCFATTFAHEISINGRKLAGSAQRRWPDIFLQHGSILIRRNREESKLATISLNEILMDNLDVKTIITAITDGFRKKLGINLSGGRLTGYEIELTERLIEEKYSKTSWNMRRV